MRWLRNLFTKRTAPGSPAEWEEIRSLLSRVVRVELCGSLSDAACRVVLYALVRNEMRAALEKLVRERIPGDEWWQVQAEAEERVAKRFR